MNFGYSEKSILYQYRALELDPLSITFNSGLATRFILIKEYSKAIIQSEELISLYPGYSYGYYHLAFVYCQMGLFKEAIENINKAFALNSSLEILALKGHILVLSGEEKEARKILDTILCESQSKLIDFMDIAHVYAALNDPDKAFEYLEKAREARINHFCILRVDPRFKNLHSDPRFNEFLLKIGLPEISSIL